MTHSAKKVASAMGWNLSFVILSAGVQILTTMTLGRLLSPRDYGIFAFANSIVVFAMHLSQRGLATTILRQPSLSPSDLGNAYIVAGVLSVLLSALTATGSAILRHIHEAAFAEQADLLLFMSIPVVLQLLATPATSLMQRQLAMVRVNVVSIAGILIGNGATAAALAIYHWGPWSLAGGALANSLVTLVLSVLLGRHAVQLSWRPSELKNVLWDAIAMNGLRALDVAWVQLPLVVLGLRAPASISGIYQRTQFVADILLQMTVWRLSSVLYAVMAVRAHEPSSSKRSYRLIFLFLATLVLPIIAFVSVGAEAILGVLLGDVWTSGGGTFRLLILAFGIATINQAAGMTLEVRGRFADRYICSGAAFLTLMLSIVAIPPTSSLIAIPPVISMGLTMIILHSRMGETWRDLPAILRLWRPGAMLAIATFAGATFGNIFAALAPFHTYFAQLVLQAIGALLLCSLIAIPVARLAEMKPFVDLLASLSPKLQLVFKLIRLQPQPGGSH